MDHERLLELIEKMESETATEAELQELDALYEAFETKENYVDSFDARERALFGERMFEHISAKTNPDSLKRQKGSTYKFWPRIAAAASILLMLSVGGYFYLYKSVPHLTAKLKPGTFKNDIQPGGNNAILTLASGKQIVLKTAKNGLLANQGNTRIQKTPNGQIKYDAGAPENTVKEISYNTVSTKRANKVDITLPDGTIAYLDAASSIHFPTVFNGHGREVAITGQVYFEVAHDKSKPFRVYVKGQTVEVLGTHFNINSYDDEVAIKTTLLEGSVKISINSQTTLLHPGEQAQIDFSNKINITRPDLDEVMAWKNGLFKFDYTDLNTVMRQLSRWYDVDVTFEGINKNHHFDGYISRNSKLSEVLQILQLSGVKFAIDGKKLVVYQ